MLNLSTTTKKKKKIKNFFLEARQTLKIECDYKQPYNLFPAFTNFRTLPEISGKTKLVDSKQKS